MAKSKMTYDELKAQAMLLGMTYDPKDHTFMDYLGEIIYNADTMGEWSLDGYLGGKKNIKSIYDNRRNQVKAGEIGAADGPFKHDD